MDLKRLSPRHRKSASRARTAGEHRIDPHRAAQRVVRLAAAGKRDAGGREARLRRDDDRPYRPARHPRGDPPRSPRRRPAASEGKDASPRAQPGQQAGATPPPQAAPAKPIDTEAPPDAAQDDQQPSIIAPEGGCRRTVVHEFRSEKWGELYTKRIDEMIAACSRPRACRCSGSGCRRSAARATSEMVYLNDLYRGRAEKAGITYVDVWDGFVDEGATTTITAPTSRARHGACAPAMARISRARARASSRIMLSAKSAA